MLAERLAGKLGYRCVDRDVIVERAAAQGVSQEELREALLKPPGFLERFGHRKYIYLALFQAALCEEVRTGNAVYHGNAGHLLLKGKLPVLRVRIIAPLEFRVAMCQDRLKLDRDEAVSYIEKMDSDRRKWAQFLYGVEWADPELYDLVVNLEHLSIAEACGMIACLVRTPGFELTPERQAAMDDYALGSRVRAALALNPGTAELELEASAEGGVVTIWARLAGAEEQSQVERVAGEVPGVVRVIVEPPRSPNRV